MGKIRQLREDILLGNNSQDKIYPITYAKAVYMDNGKTIQEEIAVNADKMSKKAVQKMNDNLMKMLQQLLK